MRKLASKTFEDIREADRLTPGDYAVVEADGSVQYAYSPDGIGCIWYNSEEDMKNGIPAE
jgi:hypothetical protein